MVGVAWLAGGPQTAAAQSRDPTVGGIIQDLTPGGVTRGIRVPQQEQPPRQQPAGGQTGRIPPPPASAGALQPATTVPPDVAAVSLMVTFATGSASLSPAAERALAPLGQALASPDLARYRFRIEGHTDTVGDAAMNQALSEQRAVAVRDHLVGRHGVSPDRLETVGLGEDQLLVPTRDHTPEARNRRVQVLNIGGG
jgi:outer membrane protein OmpA-like peptidoglycan-associated protein